MTTLLDHDHCICSFGDVKEKNIGTVPEVDVDVGRWSERHRHRTGFRRVFNVKLY